MAIDPGIDVVDAAYRHGLAGKLNVQKEDLGEGEKQPDIVYKGGFSVEDYAREIYEGKGGKNGEDERLFDVCTILEVIEHAKDPLSLLRAASSLLRRPTPSNPRGGLLILSTLNRTAKSYAVAIAGAEFVARALPVGTHDWNSFRSPEEICTLAEQCGLVQTEVAGMVPKFSMREGGIRWELDPKDVDVNWIGAYRLACA